MKKHPATFLLLILFITSLACGGTTPTQSTMAPAQFETVVAETVAALDAPDTPAPAVEPTNTNQPAPTPTSEPTSPPPNITPPPVCEPARPGAQNIPMPIGFAASVNTLSVEFFNTDGVSLGNKQTPGMTWLDPDQLHLGGGYNNGLSAMMLVYYSLENNGTLKSSENGTVNPLRPLPNFVTLTGGAGTSLLAFSTNEIDMSPDTGGWVSELYAGDAEAINGAVPMLTRSEGDGFVIFPLAVYSKGGIGQGVWYTLSMWGVGNINFAPYNGLYYFDFFSGQSTEYLPFTDRLAGISPDQTYIAYLPEMGGQPGGPGNSLTIRNQLDCQEVNIPFHGSTNLGGGMVLFAPDHQRLAWLEAYGPSSMEAQMRLRVARADGSIIVDAENAQLSGLAGGIVPVYVQPAGWLANHVLLLEVGLPGIDAPSIVKWAPDPAMAIDPALGANQSAPLANGIVGGFLYP